MRTLCLAFLITVAFSSSPGYGQTKPEQRTRQAAERLSDPDAPAQKEAKAQQPPAPATPNNVGAKARYSQTEMTLAAYLTMLEQRWLESESDATGKVKKSAELKQLIAVVNQAAKQAHDALLQLPDAERAGPIERATVRAAAARVVVREFTVLNPEAAEGVPRLSQNARTKAATLYTFIHATWNGVVAEASGKP